MANREFKVGDEVEFRWGKGTCKGILETVDDTGGLVRYGAALFSRDFDSLRLLHRKQPPKKPEPFKAVADNGKMVTAMDITKCVRLHMVRLDAVELGHAIKWLQQAKAYLEWREAQDAE